MDQATFESMQRLVVETHLTTRVHSIPALGAVHRTMEAGPPSATKGTPRKRPPTAAPAKSPTGAAPAAGAAPHASGTHPHASQEVEKAILQGITDLENAMREAKIKLGKAFNGVRDLKDNNPTHEKLHMLLIILQQGYELCKDLENMARTELRDA